VPAKRQSVADLLLPWYDAHARDLPWRVRDGAADPYRVWLSEVMLQQTTVAAVRPRFEAWVARWPTVERLAAADEADVMAAWAGLGYYARARNLLKAARAVAAAGGFPRTEAGLRTLPGLGDYTAAAVAAIAWGERAVVVDANVERVVARLSAIDTPLPAARPAIRAAADAITPAARSGDFAQAMMDLGATICTPRRPRCLLCPLHSLCQAFADGDPERLPVKPAKRAKRQRFGTIFLLVRSSSSIRPEPVEGRPALASEGRPSTSSGRTEWSSSEVLLVRRPAKGLLGAMRAFPTGPWVDAPPGLEDAPVDTDWRMLPATVAHGFTHFDLQLALAVAEAPEHGLPEGQWWPVDRLDEAGLPTIFAKVATVMEGLC
jgi:A/G-specific adenine glycosylase